MTTATTDCNRFVELFKGRQDAIGLDRMADGQGGEHKGGVVRKQVAWEDYAAHFAGERGMGVFPMLDDSTVWFGAIDLDEPNFGLAKQLTKLIPNPAFIERSRSGNAHVWVFFIRPAPAWAVRTVLRGATETIGRPDVEVFPKQDRMLPGMVGNYINLPLFGDDRPIVDVVDGMATHPVPMPTSAEGFLRRALDHRHNPDEWERRARMLGGQPPQEREESAEWGQQANLHCCAQYIMEHRYENPVRRGHRAVVYFSLAKMLLNWREATEAEAWLWMKMVNEQGAPPIAEYELRRIFDNALRGQWTSTGCDDPLMSDYADPDCPIAHG